MIFFFDVLVMLILWYVRHVGSVISRHFAEMSRDYARFVMDRA